MCKLLGCETGVVTDYRPLFDAILGSQVRRYGSGTRSDVVKRELVCDYGAPTVGAEADIGRIGHAAFASCSAVSVDSHGKSRSDRPKCPKAATSR